MENIAKLTGVVSNFNGRPLEGADIHLQDEKFECLYSTQTDKDGYYELNVEKGVYHSLFICKEYKINYLEYWAWNIPLYEDMNIDAKIDGIEVYGVNVFRIQLGIPTLSIYFRPMSLQRYGEVKIIEDEILNEKAEIINICPELERNDLVITLNDNVLEIVEINKVLEYGGIHGNIPQHIYGYLVQLNLLNIEIQKEYNKIHIEVVDRQTKEKGEGTIFWKQEKRYQGIPKK